MAKDNDRRTVGIGGLTITFERGEPDQSGKKMGDRTLAAQWSAAIKGDGDGLSPAIVNEFDDGVLYGPSSIPGCFSDFAGAAAAEVTVRWLQLTNSRQEGKLKRQREFGLMAGVGLTALVIIALGFRGL